MPKIKTAEMWWLSCEWVHPRFFEDCPFCEKTKLENELIICEATCASRYEEIKKRDAEIERLMEIAYPDGPAGDAGISTKRYTELQNKIERLLKELDNKNLEIILLQERLRQFQTANQQEGNPRKVLNET